MVQGQPAILTAKRFGVEVDTGPFLYHGGLAGRSGFLPRSLWKFSFCAWLWALSVGCVLALCLLWEGIRKVGLSPLTLLLRMKGSGVNFPSA